PPVPERHTAASPDGQGLAVGTEADGAGESLRRDEGFAHLAGPNVDQVNARLDHILSRQFFAGSRLRCGLGDHRNPFAVWTEDRGAYPYFFPGTIRAVQDECLH